jgi:hypothetical protein
MKALLDTNIVIHRENQIASSYSIGHLFRWLDRLGYTKVIHPKTIEEIRRFQDPDRMDALRIKLDAYEELKGASEPPSDFLSQLPPPRNENDEVDNALLYEVYAGYVDLLISEDKRLRAKSRALGIEDRVHSIESLIGQLSEAHPDLIEYRMLAVEPRPFRQINLDDSFFDSLKQDYEGFETWFRSKSIETAYVCTNQDDALLGFMYIKSEDEDEDYRDITPALSLTRRLKIGTFKVESTGFRLGERFLQIAFGNARERRVSGSYLTAKLENAERPEIAALVQLIQSWGFTLHGQKESRSGTERVYTKSLGTYDNGSSIKENFPNLRSAQRAKRFLPILARYHTHLFPDSILRNENPRDYSSNVGFRYALQKMYITWAPTRNAQVGDYILVYRMGANSGRKAYESTLTTLSVITELKSNFGDWEVFRRYCSNRTVFTEEELREFWNAGRQNLAVVSFIYVRPLTRRPILKELWDGGIVAPPSGPRPFEELSDTDFRRILDWSETPIVFVDEV